MDIVTVLTGAISAAGGGGLVGALVVGLIKHQLAADRYAREKLATKVDDLEKKRIEKLERDLERHLCEDNPAAQQIQLETIKAMMERFNNKLDRVAEDLAAVKSTVEANERYTENLDKSLQNLRTEVHQHDR